MNAKPELATKDGKSAKKAPTKRTPKHNPAHKITLLKDKEGVAYGPENNPKRAGSESAVRFAHYKTGMTVEAALAAGVRSADLDWDTKHDFIQIG